MEDKICAGIVLFNPDPVRLTENIRHISEQVEEIVLVDNSDGEFVDELIREEGITYLPNHHNYGIAYAMNQICQWGISKGYKDVLLLDQDSVVADQLVSIERQLRGTDVAVISPRIIYRENEEASEQDEKGHKKVEWTITSGSLVNLRVWEELGGFDEILFIDGVDYDYCVRANRAGYSVIRTYDTYLIQELGRLKCRSLFGRVIYVTNHPAFRYYYMARNQVYLRRKLTTGTPFKDIFKYMIKVLLYEDLKAKKLGAIIKGTRDGARMKA